MGLKLPQANLYFNQYTDTQLYARGLQVHNGLAANALLFPTPPVTLTDFLALLTDYKNKTAAAIKGSKSETSAKTTAKRLVMINLRTLGIFVTNTILQQTFAPGNVQSIEATKQLILLSGFTVSQYPSPTSNATAGIPLPIVRKVISLSPGTLYILVRGQQKRKRVVIDTSIGRKLWQVQYRTSAIPGTTPVPAGIWQTATFTSSNITVQDLTSGLSYDYQIAAIGGRNTKVNNTQPVNYTPIASVVII